MENPFIIQRDILYGEPFCDREFEIERYLAAARMGESLCLISPRRYGKTSLLNQVAGRLQKQGWLTAKIDFMQTLSDMELAKEIERTRLNLLGKWQQTVHKLGKAMQDLTKARIDIDFEDLHFSLGLEGSSDADGRVLLRRSLSRLLEITERTGTPVMIYFDEFQRIREIDPTGNLEAMVRTTFQKRTNKFLPMYLGSRRHMLQMMFADKSTPLFKTATVLSLNTMRMNSFAVFAKQQFKQTLQANFPEHLASAMCHFYLGHPHLLNKTSAYVWDLCLREGLKTVTKEICKTAMLTITREETEAFLEMNRKTPLNYMTVLRQVSVRGTVPKPYSGEFLRICKLTQSQMQKIIETLIADDKIHRDDTGIHIVDPLERLALRMIGTTAEWRSEMIQDLLGSVETKNL